MAYIGEVEVGARALAGVARYEEKIKGLRRLPLSGGPIPESTRRFRSLKPGTVFGEHEVKELLKEYGIPVVPELAAATQNEAVKAAGTMGYPVAVKVDSPDIAHKTEVNLTGARGRGPSDLEALVKVLLGVARLGMDRPELAELDINPIYVLPEEQGGLCRRRHGGDLIFLFLQPDGFQP